MISSQLSTCQNPRTEILGLSQLVKIIQGFSGRLDPPRMCTTQPNFSSWVSWLRWLDPGAPTTNGGQTTRYCKVDLSPAQLHLYHDLPMMINKYQPTIDIRVTSHKQQVSINNVINHHSIHLMHLWLLYSTWTSPCSALSPATGHLRRAQDPPQCLRAPWRGAQTPRCYSSCTVGPPA